MNKELDLYYPDRGLKTNYYALYSTALERFLLVDYHSPFVFLQVAHVLSSKITPIVYLLQEHKKYPKMTNENCMQFSISQKLYHVEASGKSMKQNPVLTTLRQNIYRPGLPKNYFDNNEIIIVNKLRDYAIFCQQCLHAIALTSMFYSQEEIETTYQNYNSVFFKDFDTKHLLADYEKTKDSTMNEISRLLYYSTDKETALDEIKKIWLDKIQADYSTRIKFFYKILGAEQPTELKNFKKEKIVRLCSGTLNAID